MNFEQLEQRNMLATLIGTPGDDIFVAGPGWANLNGTAYVGDYDFDGMAGKDIASLYDTPADDVFTVRPSSAELGNIKVMNCEIIHGYAKAGGNDTALMTGTTGNDWSIGKVTYAKLVGVGSYLRAKFFETVEMNGGGGNDWGKVYDSAEDDMVIMKPGDVTLFGPKYSQTLRAFDFVHAYAKSGGYDSAHLYGDHHTGRETYTRMFGEGTVNRAKLFEEVSVNRERVNAPTYELVLGEIITMTGTHTLRRSIELRSDETLIGDALLQRGKTVQKNLTQDAREGVIRLFVPDTTGYRLGDELTVLAYKTGTECVIVADLGSDWVEIENPLSRTYTVANHVAIVNYFPLIRAVGTGITIQGLTIDGNRDPTILQWQIIGGGLIHMETTNSVIQDVIVVNSPSTGILMQDGRDNLVIHCYVGSNFGHGMLLDQEIDTTIEYTMVSYNGERGNGDGILINGGAGHLIHHNLARHNERYGLHPAGELTRGGVWRDNDASGNGSNGFHFCYNNFNLLVRDNTLNNNGRSGVGGFGRGGEYADRFNIVTGNTATGNWRYGIETNGGSDNTITFNNVRGNRLGGIRLVGNHIISNNEV